MPPSAAIIRPLCEADLPEADRIFRVAFGTQFGLADPTRFRGDSELIGPRWLTDSRPCFAAEFGGRIIGSIVGMDWGSAFVVGPLSVVPEQANRGVGHQLMAATMTFVAEQRFPLAVLYTLPNSPKHIRLYEGYGFHAQRLTPVMAKVPEAGAAAVQLWSGMAPAARQAALLACKSVSCAIFPGLDLTREIAAMATQSFGETVLLVRDGAIAGFALCHLGKGSEAGSGALYVKFACVRPGEAADFVALVDACEALAAQRGAARIVAGTNMAREAAYRIMLERGYRAEIVGVAMTQADRPGWNRPEVFALDDWR